MSNWPQQFRTDTKPCADGSRLTAALAKELEVVFRAHFRTLESTHPNVRGWPRQHFWSRVRKLVAYSYTDKTATVLIDDPAFVHQLEGGPITPKSARALALPAQAAAYKAGGPRASGRTDLVFVPIKGKGKLVGLLYRARQTTLAYTQRPGMSAAPAAPKAPAKARKSKWWKPMKGGDQVKAWRQASRPSRKSGIKKGKEVGGRKDVWYWIYTDVTTKPHPYAAPALGYVQMKLDKAVAEVLKLPT